jgi:serine/threonine-protein kinase
MTNRLSSVDLPMSGAENLIADVIEEVTNRLQAGKVVDVEAYVAAYPQHATELRQLLPALGLVRDLSQSLANGPASANPSGLDGPAEIGTAIGDFRLIREVGRGGMGIVYEAEQMSLKRRVALKVLPFAGAMDSRQLQRFKNESLAAAQLHHTNIVPVYYVGCERGIHFYAMQFIEGQSLAEVIAELRNPASGVASAPRVHSPEIRTPEKTTAYAPEDGAVASPEALGALTRPRSPETKPIAALSTLRSTTDAAYFRTVAELGIQAAEALDYAH